MDEFLATGLPSQLIDSLEHAWTVLASPGTVWTGAERLAIVTEARRARAGLGPKADLPPVAAEAARLLAASPATARRAWVEGLVDRGLDQPHYVELLGVVSRLAAIDSFHEALGLALTEIPKPVHGKPSGQVSDQAHPGRGWVPMVSGASIIQALSLVPHENEELERFHGPMYLFYEEMSDPHVARGLSRPQMELVAARTSAINECFY